MRIALVLYVLSFIALSAEAQEIYKCTIDGKLIFTDQPCAADVYTPSNTGSFYSADSLEQDISLTYSSSKWFQGQAGYKKALKYSEKYDVPIFIYFQVDWCGYCRKLEKNLIHNYRGKRILKKVVKVVINPEDSDANNQLFIDFGGKGYPSTYIQKKYDSTPKKYRLVKRVSGKWTVIQFDELSKLISSHLT